MRNAARFLAVDLGASSGRVMSANWDGRRFALEELHRFSNCGVRVGDRLHWDVLNIWTQMQAGFTRFSGLYQECPVSIGVDAWGIDFGLLDASGRLIGNPAHYRDQRTEGMPNIVFSQVKERMLFVETGVQSWRINTLFQLYSMVIAKDPQLECAATLLTIPDLFSFFLCGAKRVEYTEATTTEMYSLQGAGWARDILAELKIPAKILPEVVQPGTTLGSMRKNVLEDCGFGGEVPVIAVASHDTASAVAALPEMDSESAFISSGTWSLMGTEVVEPNTSEDARRLQFTNEGAATGGFLLLKNLAGLWIIQECLRFWEKEGQRYEWSDLLQAAKDSKPFRSLFDPNDKRFDLQNNMPLAIRDYCRDTGQPVPETTGAFARAVFESLVLTYRLTLASLENLIARELPTIRVVGGGSRNGLLCQMIADACCRRVVAGPAEATSLGNVMVQAIATGHLSGFDTGRACIAESFQRDKFEPHPSAGWDDAYARFRAFE